MCWFRFEKPSCLCGMFIQMLYTTMSDDSKAIIKYNNSKYTIAVGVQPIQDQLRKNENRPYNCRLFVCNWVQKMYWQFLDIVTAFYRSAVYTKLDYIRRLRKRCIGFFHIGYIKIIITKSVVLEWEEKCIRLKIM